MNRVFRLAIINSHPIQYFAPLYAYLNREPTMEITVLYCSDSSLRGELDPEFKQAIEWDINLMGGYRSIFLGESSSRRTPKGFWSLICPQVWSEIRRDRYDAVWLYGYNYAAYVIALLAAKTKGLPILMRSATHLGLRRSVWKRWLRDSVLSIAYRWVDGFTAIGTANRAYYRALGVPEEKIFDVSNTVDNDRFIAASTCSREQRVAIRKQYGLSIDRPVVLYASKFIRRKHPDVVIRAMACLRDRGFAATLFMVGAGEMEQELRNLSTSLGIMDSVVFGGFINQAALPRVYAGCDVFVLPSENEPWGLIVNEAMCAGIPVVVSDEVGCVADLVKDGVNGYQIKPGDMHSLAMALEKLLSDKARREQMGAASLSIIRDWNYERCRQGIGEALQHCVGNR